MKVSTILIVATMFAISSCHSSGSSSVTALNSTETQLIGTWYLQKQVDSGSSSFSPIGTDTTITGFSSSYYITFKSTEFGTVAAGAGANWLQYTGSWLPAEVYFPTSTTGTSITDYWYYDNTIDKLDIVTSQCSIVTLTSSQLIVYYNSGTGGSVTSYFNK